MNVNEIREESVKLQKRVLSLLEEFTEKTGCVVEVGTETTEINLENGTTLRRIQEVHTKVIL